MTRNEAYNSRIIHIFEKGFICLLDMPLKESIKLYENRKIPFKKTF